MKITNLFVANFIGAAAVEVRTTAPVQLFCGKNASGKSSIRDAVALALTAELGRVHLKKEAAALIRDGSDTAVCKVVNADGETWGVTITRAGKVTETHKGRTPDPTLPYVLNAQRLAQLDATERRAFLFGLTGAKMDAATVTARLAARGCDAAKVERIAPLLRAGFDAASKDAKAKATEAKGAWRAITGETYGAVKADTWRATVPPFDAEAAKMAATELQHCDVAAASWQQQLGKLQAEEQRRAALRTKLPALKDHAGRLDRITTKLDIDTAQLTDAERVLADTKAAAGAGPRVGLVHDLAAALNDTLFFVGAQHEFRAHWQATLDAYQREHGQIGSEAGDPAARERLPEQQRSRDLLASAVANDKRDQTAAQQAAAEAAAIEAELAETFDAAALADARTQLDALKTQRAEIVRRIDAMKTVKAAVDAAQTKTSAAVQHHVDVAAWDAIGDALAPDGIPGEILAEAMGPVNERLASSAVDTDWPRVVIDADMAITADGRAYRLLSESERWRVDAMLAEAVASLSGARLLVLDRVDVLDLQGRSELLSWLDTLASAGELYTALLFATLKAPPTKLPSSIAVHWIENGVVGQLLKAVA